MPGTESTRFKDIIQTGRGLGHGEVCCPFLQDVVDHLESTRQALTAEQLREAVQHDIEGNTDLYNQLQNNPKIRINPEGKYEYKV